MKAATQSPVIDVQALRVGMFVHLDVGWMSHPFPLSSFRISTPAQVATIRSLGLTQVRWSPQQSDPEAMAPAPEKAVADVVEPAANESTIEPAADLGESPADRRDAERRRRLQAQRE